MPVDVFLDSTATGIKTTAELVIQEATGVIVEFGMCAADTADAILNTLLGRVTMLGTLNTVIECTGKAVLNTVSVVANSALEGANMAYLYGTFYGVMQIILPSLIALGVVVLIYAIILYLHEKGNLKWFHRYKRRFINNIKKKYNEFRMSRKKQSSE
ncbi:hypothetical protein AK88_05562 [Plasmodium fragile]|uniref:Uncharacterized protein n=1 Tax=Plasmodium fragile TaxID=5857 RepID=A0A0D9QDA3_PLAFR|nr:uncharacterized protein AK88_05562 [Plasmodium fragile]KJP84802.1 hypothetical protein AK88_05562 [Plasmodium fragile]